MAENKSQGFATQKQLGGSAGGGSGGSVPIVIGEDQKVADIVNKAIQKYDEYIKNYLKGFLKEDSSEVTIMEHIKYYMDGGGFKDRKLTDTPTDAYSMVNRKFVATSTVPSNPVVGQMYFSGGKQQFWNGSAWVTWPDIP